MRVHTGDSREILQKAELVDIARCSEGKTEADQDDCVWDRCVLEDVAHQS